MCSDGSDGSDCFGRGGSADVKLLISANKPRMRRKRVGSRYTAENTLWRMERLPNLGDCLGLESVVTKKEGFYK